MLQGFYPGIYSPDPSGLRSKTPCCPDASGFRVFAPQRIYGYAFVAPVSTLSAKPRGLGKDIKVKFRIAAGDQNAPTACFAEGFESFSLSGV